MGTQVVRVQGKGQVTIPVEIRDKLNLKKGDLVTFVATEEGVIIKPAELAEIDRLAAEIGARWPEGLAAKEAVAEGRR
jgi:AbrB family looped-hinge helix DNA binding protein